MTERINIISDTDLNKELLDNLMSRDLEQKFQYLEEGASLFYRGFDSKEENELNEFLGPSDYANFFFDNFSLKNGEKVAIVSLGCGNASPEKKLLRELEKREIDVTYFGVDSSKEMLDLAEENLSDVNIKKKFILADITTEVFEDEISSMLQEYQQRFFSFLGGTFNNPNQTSIADRLFNLLEKGDFLWLDITTRKDLSATNNMRLYWQYEQYLQDKEEMNSTFYPLKKVGLDMDSGKMELKMLSEEAVWALKLLFLFEVRENREVFFRKRHIHFGEKQQINLLYIRIYHLPTFINFLESFSFKLVSTKVKEVTKWSPKVQIMLQK